jgi:hypothetical protein
MRNAQWGWCVHEFDDVSDPSAGKSELAVVGLGTIEHAQQTCLAFCASEFNFVGCRPFGIGQGWVCVFLSCRGGIGDMRNATKYELGTD